MRSIRFTLLLGFIISWSGTVMAQTDTLGLILESYQDSNFNAIQRAVTDFYSTRDKGRGTGYKQWRRYEWFVEPRLGPTGKRMNLTAKRFQEIEAIQTGRSALVDFANWEFVGPVNSVLGAGWSGGVGRVNAIAFHPTSSATIYVATYGGGIWKTTNDGGTWNCLSDALPIQSFAGIEVSHSDPSDLYALTGPGYTSIWGLNAERGSMGVLKSTNGGNSWSTTGLTWSDSIRVGSFDLEMHPTNSDMLFVCSDSGIHKSDDAGVTWDLVFSGGTAMELVFHPSDSLVMYASDYNRITSNPQARFLKSTDAGDSWTPISSGFFPPNSQRIALVTNPLVPSLVIAMFGDRTSGPAFDGLFLSVDEGATWSLLNAGPADILGGNIGGGGYSQPFRNNRLAWDPSNAVNVIAGGINVWRSSNSGSSFTQSSYWRQDSTNWEYTHADINDLQYNPMTGDLYCASDGGIFKSDDHGVTWNDITDGLEIATFYGITTTSQDYDLIYGGTQDNGCNKWEDGVYTQVRGADGMICRINPDSSQVAYTCRQDGWIERTDDGGLNFSPANPKSSNGEGWDSWVTPYVLDLANPDTLYAGYDDVWRSYNKGASWTRIFNGSVDIRALEQAPSNHNRMYMCTAANIWRTDNVFAGSPTWNNINANLPVTSATLSDIAVGTINSNVAWVCFSGYTPGQKVYMTTDGGVSWTNISGSLPNLPVNTIVRDKFGNQQSVYIGTDAGVFYWDWETGDWEEFRNGLPDVIVMDLEINNEYNVITAGTYGRGIYRSTLHDGCPDFYTLTESGNPSANGTQVYQANNFINSNRIYAGDGNTNINYQAGETVTLTPGFLLPQNGKLTVKLAECDE